MKIFCFDHVFIKQQRQNQTKKIKTILQFKNDKIKYDASTAIEWETEWTIYQS